MVKMTCPLTGAILYVDESRVEKYKQGGYKPVEAKRPRANSRKTRHRANSRKTTK